MEEQAMWSPSPSVVVISDSEEMEVYVEEIIIEEDGSPVEQKWNVDDVLTLSPSGFAKSLDESSSSDLTDPLAQSPQYIIPDLLTTEEDNLLDESFELMEDLMSKKNHGFQWKEEVDRKVVAEKAQELLDDLNKDSWLIKEEPFSDWLEEKTELPLLEELGGYVNSYQSRPVVLPATIAVPYHPRPFHIQTPHIGEIAPQLATSSGLALFTATAHIDLANISAHVPAVSAEVPPVNQSSEVQQPPLTPALIREFETVLHQTLTPPHTPPTYVDLVKNQEEDIKTRELAEDELDALINSQVASFYEEKQREKAWLLGENHNSPTSEWGSTSTSATTEDSDSACQSSSESDPEWAPSRSLSHGNPTRNRRSVSSTEERKLRKKEQNKNAATRYRLKKKAEQAGIVGEESVLLDQNISLKEKATELQREIKYLKSLMKDICKAKGLIQ